MKRLAIIAMSVMLAVNLMAQPAKKRTQPIKGKVEQSSGAQQQKQSVRKFPAAPTMSEDVAWRRDVYRTLDLTKDANAPLYYPVEPVGKQMNLFTYVFRLLLDGRIAAYNYTLDGNENFEKSNRVDVKDMMERYRIFYEEKDGKHIVAAQDIPSAEVTRYYIKESSYFDQRTSTYRQKVVALCPVLMRADDEFSSEATPMPLFWLNYDEIASYLSRLPVMASNMNNVTNMTADDFFALNRYDGKIYKTNNMQGRVLANYCKDDSTMACEQKRIEKELADFEKGIWTTQHPDTTKTDSTTVEAAKGNTAKKKTKDGTSSTRRAKAAASKSSASSNSGSRVSARRQRR